MNHHLINQNGLKPMLNYSACFLNTFHPIHNLIHMKVDLSRLPKWLCLVCLLFLCLPEFLSAQVTYNKRQTGSLGQAPEVSDMSAGATLDQVEYLTGTAKINIPIYTIKVKDITVPISISYSTHGRRPLDPNSIIGDGWTLNAGGGIQRHLNGLPDENTAKGIGYHALPFSTVSYTNPQCLGFTQNMVDGKADGAWDVFSYNLPTGSGQFMKDGMTFPYDPTTSITAFLNSGTYVFNIATKNGIRYEFSEGDKEVFKARRFYTSSDNPIWIDVNSPSIGQWNGDSTEYIANWNVSRIYSSRFKDTVFFNYETHNYNNTVIRSNEALPMQFIAQSDGAGNFYPGAYYRIDHPIISQTRVRTAQHKRLSTIAFPNGRLVFTYDATYYPYRVKLSDVLVQQSTDEGTYQTIRKIRFADEGTLGTQLTNLYIYDSEDSLIHQWKFGYNYSTGGGFDLNNRSIDYWGFYNNIYNNTLLSLDSNFYLMQNAHYPIVEESSQAHLYFPVRRQEGLLYYGFVPSSQIDDIPSSRPTDHVNFGNRQARLQYELEGTLDSITMPTGASVHYEYESNKFQQQKHDFYGNHDIQIVEGGGLRIKTIRFKDALGRPFMRKEYKYGWGDPQTVPEVTWQTGYGYINRPGNVLTTKSVYVQGTTPVTIQNLLLLSDPVNDMALYNGAYVVYETVGEYLYSDTTANGATVYFYQFNAPDNTWDVTNPYTSYTLNAPSFYVNSGIRNMPFSGIPVKTIIMDYNNHYHSFSPKRIIKNHIISFQNPNPGLKCYFAGIQGELTGVQGTTNTWCNFSPGGHTDITCFDISGIPAMDNPGISNYTGDSQGLLKNAYYDGKYGYYYGDFAYKSACYRIDTTTVIDEDYPTMVTKTIYAYDNPGHLMPTRIMTVNSNNDTTTNHITYARDFSSTGGSTPISIVPSDIVETTQTLKKPGGTENIIGSELKTYDNDLGMSKLSDIYSYNSGGALNPYSSFIHFDGTSTMDSHYEIRTEDLRYDYHGNLTRSIVDGKSTYIQWGYNYAYPVAVAQNGYTLEFAYTSFENEGGPIQIPDGGFVNGGATGEKAYNLAAAGSTGVAYLAATPFEKYIVSYYSNSSSPYTISGTQDTPKKFSMPGWNYYQHIVTGVSPIVVTGNGYIDELRICDIGALLTTYTYDPLIGITSMVDPSGKITHYGYDRANRLDKVWDDYINLIKTYKYRYQAPPNE